MSRPKPPRSSLVGPLAGWELVRLARRGQSHRARLLLLYILVLTFVGFALYWFTTPGRYVAPRELFLGSPQLHRPELLAAFGSEFALAVLLAKLAVVTVITPAYAAAAIAEEKDRKTLQLLLTTGLSDREIVFGKAAARAGFVLAVVFAGTPVLMLARLFGGIDFAFLVSGYLLIAGTTALTTALGLQAACRTPNLRAAVLRAYGWTAVFVSGMVVFAIFSPFGVLVRVHGEPAEVSLSVAGAYAAVQFAASVGALRVAARSLRAEDQPPPVETDFPLPPKPADPHLVWHEEVARPPLPRLDARRPVLWKERCLLVPWAESRQVVLLAVGGFACLLMVIGAAVLISRQVQMQNPLGAAELARSYPEPPDSGGWLLVSGGVLALGAYLVPLALGAAGVIARERERQTLDSLLSVPLGRREILAAKLRAHAERAWPLGVAAVLAVGFAFGADGGAWLGLAAGAAALGGVGFVVGLGTFLSVRCSGELRAFRLLLPALVVVIGLPVGVYNGIDWGRVGRWVPGYAAASAGFALAGLALWRRAVRELERGG